MLQFIGFPRVRYNLETEQKQIILKSERAEYLSSSLLVSIIPESLDTVCNKAFCNLQHTCLMSFLKFFEWLYFIFNFCS